ncbi:hypothetical protein A2982_03560 [candidate division WWE3 bacterium RIFCSPLOWO2_01_FULL_39_13]|uniref:Trigger factor ribosome-binding bacterial domain-containing protein n=1 Tax=candidate division WWE3 bacterium RIFCSPLOWO2_01_FULL_39_13 TaxID=1802624 RepID=A0A1F4V469_UNCKA|nr:MAG: hypothetical protein A2982_03560 [candidate division WWE3 bacterium RIFCSPLOWO2_01_FULL_39_13]
MDIKVDKQQNNTYKIDVKVEKEKVTEAYEESLKHEAEKAEIKGFRKGKAPLSVVKENVDKSKLRGHALNRLLQKIYSQIINEYKLKPIVYPKFEIKEFDEGKDLTLVVTIVELPEIKTGDYKTAVRKIKLDSTSTDIASQMQKANQEIIKTLLEVCNAGISEVLVEEELNRMMSSLIDQTSKMGLTVDQYLQAVKKTADDIRKEYRDNALATLKADFIITEISRLENIEVLDDEIEKTIQAIPDLKSREEMSKSEHKMYIKAVLIKNKTLQKLAEYISKSDSKSEGSEKKSSEKQDENNKKWAI